MANTVENKKTQRMLRGEVMSTDMNKTIVVQVNTMKHHEKYNKTSRVSKKYHVHDEKGEAKVGNIVDFVECRPLSATKRWLLSKVVKETK